MAANCFSLNLKIENNNRTGNEAKQNF